MALDSFPFRNLSGYLLHGGSSVGADGVRKFSSVASRPQLNHDMHLIQKNTNYSG